MGEDEPCPCDGAKREKYSWTQVFDMTEAEFGRRWPRGKSWRNVGQNHRETDDGIVRDFEDEGWFVEFASLDEIISFIKEYGEVVISVSDEHNQPLELEIYDDYRE